MGVPPPGDRERDPARRRRLLARRASPAKRYRRLVPRRHLSGHKVPRSVILIDRLPAHLRAASSDRAGPARD